MLAIRQAKNSLSVSFNIFRRQIHFRSTRCLHGAIKPKSNGADSKKVLNLVKKLTKRKKRDTSDLTSRESILFYEIEEALNDYKNYSGISISLQDIKIPETLIFPFLFSRNRPKVMIPKVDIIYQNSEGEGLGLVSRILYASEYVEEEDIFNKYTLIKVPKTVVGDKVAVELLMHHNYYAESRLIEILNPKSKVSKRKNRLIVCDSFDSCSGCHLQMLPYEQQLNFKRDVITKAYRFFAPDIKEEVENKDSFGVTNPSPLQYAYRTKLTPHYSLPNNNEQDFAVGFNNIDPTKRIVDIDHCPIASITINNELPVIREKTINFAKSLSEEERKRERNRTILLRDSVRIDNATGEYEYVCLTSSKKVITEKVEDNVFQFSSSDFFQNNNSVLPQVLDYLRYHINRNGFKFKYLIDTYCGSGFFGISLHKSIQENGKVFGIELSKKSIEYANHNAKLNGILVPDKIQFIEGAADLLFKHDEFINSKIVGEESIVIMDPSRKGSNENFIRQLLDFKPKMIIYISCNVFTQARDIQMLKNLQSHYNCQYKVREVVGFDFFPQTKHVESITILDLVV